MTAMNDIIVDFRGQSGLGSIGVGGVEWGNRRAGDGQVVDQSAFDFVLGLELGVEGFGEGFEAVHGFAVEGDDFGEEAVVDRVLGGDLFAGGGFGAAGFRAVDAGGLGAER